jgi:hypothetical protein
MRRRSFWRTLAVTLCLLFSFITATAQSSTATLSGTVSDQNGDMIPGANVAVINVAQGFQRTTTTNAEGIFVVPLLPPGAYTVKAEQKGFSPAEVRDVALNVNDQVTIRIQLSVGSIGQTVSVVESTLVDESSTVSTAVDRQFVENMPLNGRSFQPLISLTPGVVTTKTNYNEQGQFSVNGQRANANYFTVDGVSANVGVAAGVPLVQSAGGSLPAFSAAGSTNSLVSIDAMQEFKIQTSTFAPEFGRTPGAQISIATRSGGNDFHGTVFDYFRNEKLDANDWFANSRRQPRAALRQNDFGGVFSGPLHLPRFGEGGPAYYDGTNSTFFFFSYEGLRLRQPATQVTLVPSVASRLAALPSRRPYLNAYPIPNGPVFSNGFAEFTAAYSDPLNLDATSLRVDHAFNENVGLFVRYNHSPSETTQRGTAGRSLNVLSLAIFKTQTLTAGLTHSITPQLINEVRANYTRTEGANDFSIDGLGGAIPLDNSLVFPAFASPDDAFFSFGFPTSAGRTLNTGKSVVNTQRQINLIDNLSYVTGGHQLKFGVDYRLLLPVNGPRGYDQIITFSGLTGATGAISGNASLASVSARDTVALSYTNFSLYGQDTWKVTDRLTVTYGLRWDVNPPPIGRHGKELVTFDNVNGPGPLTVAPLGTPLYETTYNNFAPRVGMSYQLFRQGNRLTILRGGFGVFYDLGTGTLASSAAVFPYARSRNLVNVPFPLTPAQIAPPPFSLAIPTLGLAFIADRNLQLPRTFQWNTGVEQSLNSSNTFSASYIGAAGRRLLRRSSKIFPPQFGVSITDNSADSDYHGMQLQFQRRMSRGLQLLTSYTWSHSIDTASNDSGLGSSPTDPNRDRGSSDFDVRHSFSTAATYALPSPQKGQFAKALLGNWFVDAMVTARSAVPVDLVSSFSAIINGLQTVVRPDLVPGLPLYLDDPLAPGGRRFNNTVDPSRPGCKGPFCPTPPGRQGTLGRNVMRGFPMWQADLALRRQFSLGERATLQLRAEAFNIFNHPNFGDPGTNTDNAHSLTSPFFGQSTQMLKTSLGTGGTTGGFSPLYQIGGPRSIQLAPKLQF